MGSFGGLSIGISGLFAQQRALDVTGHNISNVNTPGYSRQTIFHSASTPERIGINLAGNIMQRGMGVDVQQIKQYRDEFLEQKLRRENNGLGYWEKRESAIEELESIFNDNSEEGLQSVMDDFWNSWAQLAKPTGGLTARALVKESSIAFIETTKLMDQTLDNFRINKDNEIREDIDSLNRITGRIAELNFEIKKVEAGGAVAGDFRDERNSLIAELSKMANIQVHEGAILTIAIEGRLVVEDDKYEEIAVVNDNINSGYAKLLWKSSGENLTISGGSIKALFETRDELVDGFKENLREFVHGVACEVNKLHYSGYGIKDDRHRNIFISTDTNPDDSVDVDVTLDNIKFNTALNDLDNIAAAEKSASEGNYEDNAVATKLEALRKEQFFYLDKTDNKYKYEPDEDIATYDSDEFYRIIIAELGVMGQEAVTEVDGLKMLVSQVENRILEVSAVSIDEEMTNLIKFEHSYNACARVVNAMDEMLDYIVNRIGVVGR